MIKYIVLIAIISVTLYNLYNYFFNSELYFNLLWVNFILVLVYFYKPEKK